MSQVVASKLRPRRGEGENPQSRTLSQSVGSRHEVFFTLKV